MDGIQDAEKKLHDVYLFLGQSAARVGQLEAENAALRAQLEGLLQSNYDPNQGGKPKQDPNHIANGNSWDHGQDHEVSVEQFNALGRQYVELQENHSRLQNQHAGCQRKIDEALQKARSHKSAAKEWKAYSEHKERERNAIQTAASKTADERNPASMTGHPLDKNNGAATPRPPTTSPAKPSHSATGSWGKSAYTSSELPSSPPRLRDGRIEGDAQQQLHTNIARFTSSQTTVEDLQCQDVLDSPVKPASSSDSEPVVVSSRSLKRKAGKSATAESAARRIKQEPDLDNTVIELNSDPTGCPRRTPELSMAHSDLDTTGAVVVTPHRPKRAKNLHQRATPVEAARLPQLNSFASSLSDGAQILTPISIKAEPGETAHRNQDACVTDRSSHPSGFANGHSHGILRPISGNVSLLLQSKDVPMNAKPRSKGGRARDQVALLSEDGDDGTGQSKARSHSSNGSAVPSAEKDGRLEQMLNEPSPDRPAAALPQLPPSAQALARKKSYPAASVSHLITPVSAVKRTSPVKQTDARRTRFRLEDSPPPVRPEDKPLRLRDVKTLKLHDFKINPKYMGTDYAFADTLRGRDQRRALHTCSKPDCCGGALQKVIAMGGASLSGKTDAQALEAYMGPNWGDLIKTQGPEKEKQFTLQAHAHCFANQHGKHRQAFVRRTTPPGFWRTDFPTTQEAENDRGKAREIDRDAVQERFREAMREGGRWKFRDE